MKVDCTMSMTVNEDGQLVMKMSFPEGIGLSLDTLVRTRKDSAGLAIEILARQGKLRCRCGALYRFEEDGSAVVCSDADPQKTHGL